MSSIVQISDFKGYHYIANNSACNDMLQEFIDRYEEEYLCMLLGNDLMISFLADLTDGVPTNTDYLAFFNPFCEVLTDCYGKKELSRSKGLKDALLGIIFYQFVSNYNVKSTLTGLVNNKNENSELLDYVNTERFAEKRWNESVESYNSIGNKIVSLALYEFPVTLKYKFLDLV